MNLNDRNFLICSDSYSALQTLKSNEPNSLAHEIFDKVASTDKTIEFEWIPSHMGIPGNDAADLGAKSALYLDNISQIPIAYNQFKTRVKNHLCKKWQDRWDHINSPPNQPLHLYPIKPVIKDWPSAHRNNREEEIVLARLRLKACLFNKKHLFENKTHPECEHCDVPLTIQHILIDCNLFYNERGPMLTALRENDLPMEVSSILNEYFPAEILITFLKNINYFHKI